MKTPKTATLRTRCEPDLKRSAEKLADSRGLDVSDIVRFALRNYISQTRAARRNANMLLT